MEGINSIYNGHRRNYEDKIKELSSKVVIQVKKNDNQNNELKAVHTKLRTIEVTIKTPLLAEIKVKDALITSLKA